MRPAVAALQLDFIGRLWSVAGKAAGMMERWGKSAGGDGDVPIDNPGTDLISVKAELVPRPSFSFARTLEDLPENARNYVLALEKLSGTRFLAMGVGPGRDQTIVVHDLMND